MKKLATVFAVLVSLLLAVVMVGTIAGAVMVAFWRPAGIVQPKPDAPQHAADAGKDPLAHLKGSDKGLRVLFVGNSHTGSNNLSELVTKLADAGKVERPLLAWSHSPSATSFKMHWEAGDVQRLLGQAKWDLVVLQDQSAMPNLAKAERDRETLPYARLLNGKIKESGARTVLFMTWGYRDFFVPMQKKAQSAYQELADDLQADLVPVGMAWQKAHATRPGLALWTGDGNHATMHGSYLAACCFYAAFYGVTPVGNTFTADLPAADAHFLQDCAAKVVKIQPGGLAAKAPGRGQ